MSRDGDPGEYVDFHPAEVMEFLQWAKEKGKTEIVKKITKSLRNDDAEEEEEEDGEVRKKKKKKHKHDESENDENSFKKKKKKKKYSDVEMECDRDEVDVEGPQRENDENSFKKKKKKKKKKYSDVEMECDRDDVDVEGPQRENDKSSTKKTKKKKKKKYSDVEMECHHDEVEVEGPQSENDKSSSKKKKKKKKKKKYSDVEMECDRDEVEVEGPQRENDEKSSKKKKKKKKYSDAEMESNRDEVEVEDSQNFASMHVEPPEATHIFFSSSEESTKDVDEGIPKKHKRKIKKEKKDRESINKDVPGVPDLANVSIGSKKRKAMTPNRLVTMTKGYEGDKDTGKRAVTKHVDVTTQPRSLKKNTRSPDLEVLCQSSRGDMITLDTLRIRALKTGDAALQTQNGQCGPKRAKKMYNRKESLRVKRRRGLQKEEEEELMELRKSFKVKREMGDVGT